MCVLYVSLGSKVRTKNFGCVAMGSAVLFILRYRLLLYSAGSGVNRVKVVFLGYTRACVCMFIVSKSSTVVIVRAGGGILVDPLCSDVI